MRRGIVILYTGSGQGKTSAAVGLALRSLGRGRRVALILFMKGDPHGYGELAVLGRMPGVAVQPCGLPTFVKRGVPTPQDLEVAARGLEMARECLSSGSWDLVVLDEVNVACAYGLLDPAEVVRAVLARAPGVDVVLTGREAPAALLACADTVTEMVEVRHHLQGGLAAVEGIDF